MKIIQIPVHEILQDFFFSFTSYRDITLLKESIQASGIRTPVHVRSKKNRYQLISGFSRYHIAKELRFKEIPAVLMDKTISFEEIFRGILLEHLVSKPFNLVEKARVLSILDSIQVKQKTIHDTFLPLLELPKDPKLLNETKQILDWPEETLVYIETYNLSLKQTDQFRLLTDSERTCIADLGLLLQIRSVELSEIMKFLWEISRKDETSILKIFHNVNIKKIAKNKNLTRSQKIIKIKEKLHGLRYPHLHNWNDKLQHLKQSMKLPDEIHLQWDRSLERPGMQLRCHIQSTEDINAIVDNLAEQKNQEAIQQMLEIV